MEKNRVKDHYDNHLGAIYSWMSGDFDARVADNLTFFRELNMIPCGSGVAFDLGAGSGFQTVALGKLGFRVTAVDFCQDLLDELARKIRDQDLRVEMVLNDMILYLKTSKQSPELIVCMGDTLTHLPDTRSVTELTGLAFEALAPGGRFVVSYRDLSMELTGDQRFIPVKSDSERILTCFLEYFEDRVRVNDLVHEKANGIWQHRISHYMKLRLPVSFVESRFRECGFKNMQRLKRGGFDYIIGQR